MSIETRSSELARSVVMVINNMLQSNSKFRIDTDWSHIMPKISKSDMTIKFGTRFEISVLLYLSGEFSALLDYWFAISFIDNGNYSAASYFAERLTDKTSTTSFIKQLNETIDSYLIDYMSIFVLLHEVGHGIFVLSPELKRHIFVEIDQALKNYFNRFNENYVRESIQAQCYKRRKSALDRLNVSTDYEESMTLEHVKSTFYKALDDLDRATVKEELACDSYSLSFILEILSDFEEKNLACLNICKACTIALMLISDYNFIIRRFIKLQDKERIMMTKDAQSLRFQVLINECFERIIQKGLDAGDFWNDVNQRQTDWIISLMKYEQSNMSLIRDAVNNGNSPNIENETQANFLIKGFESDIIKIYLA